MSVNSCLQDAGGYFLKMTLTAACSSVTCYGSLDQCVSRIRENNHQQYAICKTILIADTRPWNGKDHYYNVLWTFWCLLKLDRAPDCRGRETKRVDDNFLNMGGEETIFPFALNCLVYSA